MEQFSKPRGTVGYYSKTDLMTVSRTKSWLKQGELLKNQIRNQSEPNEKQQSNQHVKKKKKIAHSPIFSMTSIISPFTTFCHLEFSHENR